MKITQHRVELENQISIPWEKIKLIKVINQTIAFVLTNSKTLELKNVTRNEIDQIFRFFNQFIKTHSKS